MYSLSLFNPLKCRENHIENYLCLHEAFMTFRNDPFFSNGEGPKILENMQEFYERKTRSAMLTADQLVNQNEQNNEHNDDELEAKENGNWVSDFESDENASSSSEDDIQDLELSSNNSESQFDGDELSSQMTWNNEKLQVLST